ncbi:hypothetical protein [Streptomyces sp. MAR4 CNX-425]|uniref:hypothetical protein n=1 Tax=Streptomyces sp. MAR4 CNX-425 TaxID=3406343 RepID=UPI003B50001F
MEPQARPQIGAHRLPGGRNRLGSGGRGRVRRGRTAGGGTAARKPAGPELPAAEECRARFRTEVRAAARVGGRWTAPVPGSGAPGPWMATGYVPGPTPPGRRRTRHCTRADGPTAGPTQ